MTKSFTGRKSQYDEFLHKIQQPKMKELWDNADDEVWERLLKPKPRRADGEW